MENPDRIDVAGIFILLLDAACCLPHLTPHPYDIGYHERYRYGHPRHDFKREEAGRAVVKGQGILYVHRRDIIGGNSV